VRLELVAAFRVAAVAVDARKAALAMDVGRREQHGGRRQPLILLGRVTGHALIVGGRCGGCGLPDGDGKQKQQHGSAYFAK
jgi:hypothetical protein